MIDERWLQVKTLFQATLERPAGERAAFLAVAAGEDEALRREVESLVEADADSGGAGQSFVSWSSSTAAAFLAVSRSLLRSSAADTADAPSLCAGQRIGAYEVVEALGAGAMGEVYRARDTKLNRDVALKVLPGLFVLDADRVARLRREAQLVAALNHPNIAAIYGLEEEQGRQALVLELVEGPTLAERIALGPLPPLEALAIARQIADALAAAHEKGIVHRDLKPANIKVTSSGVVKVLDFGLAKAAGGRRGDLPPAAVDRCRQRQHARRRHRRHGGLHEPPAGARPACGRAS